MTRSDLDRIHRLLHGDEAKPLQKSKALMFMVIAIPVIVAIFAIFVVVQASKISELRHENAELSAELDNLKVQNNFYRKAYEITLEDIQALSRLYGGEEWYRDLQQELRQAEVGTLLNQTEQQRTYRLRNPGLWAEYQRSGIVKTECLSAPVMMDTVQDEVIVSVKATAANATYSVYLDGNFIEELNVSGTVLYRLKIVIPNGIHELNLLTRTGIVFNEVSFDAIAYPLSNATADYGNAWTVFDCQDSQGSPVLSRPGALRLPFEKR